MVLARVPLQAALMGVACLFCVSWSIYEGNQKVTPYDLDKSHDSHMTK